MFARCTLATAALLASVATYAQSEPETPAFYAGASVTQARYDTNDFSLNDLDDDDISWKVLAGWRFHPQFALEAGYIDFGETTATGGLGIDPFAAEAKAWVLQGVGMLPIPYVDLFAKVGVARVDAESQGGTTPGFEDRNTDFAFGWGVQWRWRNLALRGEYEKFSTNQFNDLDLISLGATYSFSPPHMR